MVYNGKPYKNGWFGGTTIFGNLTISWTSPPKFICFKPLLFHPTRRFVNTQPGVIVPCFSSFWNHLSFGASPMYIGNYPLNSGKWRFCIVDRDPLLRLMVVVFSIRQEVCLSSEQLGVNVGLPMMEGFFLLADMIFQVCKLFAFSPKKQKLDIIPRRSRYGSSKSSPIFSSQPKLSNLFLPGRSGE